MHDPFLIPLSYLPHRRRAQQDHIDGVMAMAGYFYFSEEAGGMVFGSPHFFRVAEKALPELVALFGEDFGTAAQDEMDSDLCMDLSGLDSSQYRQAYSVFRNAFEGLTFLDESERKKPVLVKSWDDSWKEFDLKMRSDPRFHAKAA